MERAADDAFERAKPAQWHEELNTQLIDPSIATINDMSRLRASIVYESQHQQRLPILRHLEKRANELYL
nr:hypothetical protein [Natrinema hispanicum]